MENKFKVLHRWSSGTHKEITVEWNGKSYHVIYGTQVNGGFCCIPNWGVGCELSSYWDDIMWNTDSIGSALRSKKAGRVIAEVIAYEEKQ